MTRRYTVKDLKKAIAKLPDDMLVILEGIEVAYPLRKVSNPLRKPEYAVVHDTYVTVMSKRELNEARDEYREDCEFEEKKCDKNYPHKYAKPCVMLYP